MGACGPRGVLCCWPWSGCPPCWWCSPTTGTPRTPRTLLGRGSGRGVRGSHPLAGPPTAARCPRPSQCLRSCCGSGGRKGKVKSRLLYSPVKVITTNPSSPLQSATHKDNTASPRTLPHKEAIHREANLLLLLKTPETILRALNFQDTGNERVAVLDASPYRTRGTN